MKWNKVVEYIKNPKRIWQFLVLRNIVHISDKRYLKMKYKYMFGKDLDLKNPKTFNEKLQWLKLYDRNPEYTKLVDKYEVKKYVSQIIGEKYIIPTLGIYNSFDEIDFDKLPNQFVMKCTHDSGSTIICKDKKTFNIAEAKEKINKFLKTNYYLSGREWPYKNVKPRILIEKYMENTDGTSIYDYKFYCFNGKTDYVMLCTERETGNPKFFFLDKNGILMEDFTKDGKRYGENLKVKNIDNLGEMLKIAEKLSQGIKFLRVDLYNVNGNIYFSEFTFYPSSGFDLNRLEITDKVFSEKLKIL